MSGHGRTARREAKTPDGTPERMGELSDTDRAVLDAAEVPYGTTQEREAAVEWLASLPEPNAFDDATAPGESAEDDTEGEHAQTASAPKDSHGTHRGPTEGIYTPAERAAILAALGVSADTEEAADIISEFQMCAAFLPEPQDTLPEAERRALEAEAHTERVTVALSRVSALADMAINHIARLESAPGMAPKRLAFFERERIRAARLADAAKPQKRGRGQGVVDRDFRPYIAALAPVWERVTGQDARAQERRRTRTDKVLPSKFVGFVMLCGQPFHPSIGTSQSGLSRQAADVLRAMRRNRQPGT